jgi:O-antigen ligase
VIGVGLVLSRGRWPRLIGAATVLTGVAGIAVSGTRSGILIFLAGVLVLQLGLRSVRRSVTFVLLGLVVASLLVLGVGGDTPVSTRLAGSQSAVQSNEQRNVVRDDSFRLVREHGWTGVGMRYLFPPHNLVLGVLAATGVIGFIGLLIVAGSLIRRLIATSPADVASIAVLAAAVGTYACMWFVNVGWDRWFWVPIALVLARPTGAAETVSPSPASAGLWRSA